MFSLKLDAVQQRLRVNNVFTIARRNVDGQVIRLFTNFKVVTALISML